MNENYKIRFFPRRIGLWRSTFKFNDTEYPNKLFDSIDDIKDFCKQQGVKFNDKRFPFRIYPIKDDICGYRFEVHQWTVIGWLSFEPFNIPDEELFLFYLETTC